MFDKHQIRNSDDLFAALMSQLNEDPKYSGKDIVKEMKNSIIVTELFRQEGQMIYRPLALLGVADPKNDISFLDQDLVDELVLAGQILISDDIGMSSMPLLMTNDRSFLAGAVRW